MTLFHVDAIPENYRIISCQKRIPVVISATLDLLISGFNLYLIIFINSILDGGVAKWLRQRSAKPLFTSSNLVAASILILRG